MPVRCEPRIPAAKEQGRLPPLLIPAALAKKTQENPSARKALFYVNAGCPFVMTFDYVSALVLFLTMALPRLSLAGPTGEVAAESPPGSRDYWAVEDPKERETLPLYRVIPAAKAGELTPANGFPKRETFLVWHRSHGDNGGTRYSALDQINRGNVTNLQAAWTYHSQSRTLAKPGRRLGQTGELRCQCLGRHGDGRGARHRLRHHRLAQAQFPRRVLPRAKSVRQLCHRP